MAPGLKYKSLGRTVDRREYAPLERGDKDRGHEKKSPESVV